MILIPTELLPVIGFFFVVIFGRIGTIILDLFRKEDVSVDITSQATDKTALSETSFVKHG